MKNKLSQLIVAFLLLAGTPALAAIYMVMPQDGGTSMQTGLSKAEGSDGWRPEMPGDKTPITISISVGVLPSIVIGKPYSFIIPLDWMNITGDSDISYEDASYTVEHEEPGESFEFNDGKLTGTFSDKKTHSLKLIAHYKGNSSDPATLIINTDDWYVDGRGVVFCQGVEKGETKSLGGKEYVSAGADKDFAAANYSTACTSNLTDMSDMKWPNKTTFNGNISHWDTSASTSMAGMFDNAHSFNQSLSNFNTSNVENTTRMFESAYIFNQPVSSFDTRNMITMNHMFARAHKFNQSLINFDTSKVRDMAAMFAYADVFNQSLASFNTKNVGSMKWMFTGALLFNQPLLNFNTENVVDMTVMFHQAYAFNQDISHFCVLKIPSKPEQFDTSTGVWNKGGRQPVWGTCPAP